jgi:hypothetical protein
MIRLIGSRRGARASRPLRQSHYKTAQRNDLPHCDVPERVRAVLFRLCDAPLAENLMNDAGGTPALQ